MRTDLSPNAHRRIDVDVSAIAKGKHAQQAFLFEAEAAIQCDGRRVIDKHLQFQPLDLQSLVGQVHSLLQQHRAHPLALSIVAYGHADAGGVGAARILA